MRITRIRPETLAAIPYLHLIFLIPGPDRAGYAKRGKITEKLQSGQAIYWRKWLNSIGLYIYQYVRGCIFRIGGPDFGLGSPDFKCSKC